MRLLPKRLIVVSDEMYIRKSQYMCKLNSDIDGQIFNFQKSRVQNKDKNNKRACFAIRNIKGPKE